MEILKRSSNSINIAVFWENFNLKKYNFDPSYQRRGDVWNDNKKSFLIDTILKNFPMPPIFLHQRINDSDGTTVYEIIDGKQRLQSIVDFIENRINIPEDFSEDGFGDSSLDGASFKDLDKGNLNIYKKMFWRYNLSIEYIDSNELNIIDNVFDRLNRNGEPLNSQELRKAKYNQCEFYKLVEDLNRNKYWTKHLSKLKINRLDDIEFISELLFVIIKEDINDASKSANLDDMYNEICTQASNEKIKQDYQSIKVKFEAITDVLATINIDYDKYKINSVSHLYGLWGFSWYLYINKYSSTFKEKLEKFYSELRSKEITNQYILDYKNSMQSNTKSRTNRVRRINSLLHFCGIFNDINS